MTLAGRLIAHPGAPVLDDHPERREALPEAQQRVDAAAGRQLQVEQHEIERVA